MREIDAELVAAIGASRTLCLRVDNPDWENARGYLFDQSRMTLYFPVARKYVRGTLAQYEVLVMGEPKVAVEGELHPATSDEDTAIQLALARRDGMDEDEARFMLLDQRTQKARRTRYKLIVRNAAWARPVDE